MSMTNYSYNSYNPYNPYNNSYNSYNSYNHGFNPYDPDGRQQAMRRHITALGVMLCLNQLIIMGGATIIDLFMAELPPRLQQLSDWYYDGELDDLIMTVVVLAGYMPVALYNRESQWSLRQQLAPTNVSAGFVLAAFVFLFAGNSIGSYLVWLYDTCFNALGFTAVQWEYAEGSTVFYTVMLIVYGVIVAPVMEELVFRGTILMQLRRYGDRFAIVASAILFGVMHGNFDQLIPTFIVGLVLGYVCVYTGSIRICIVLHALNNLLVTVMYDFLLTGEWTSLYSVLDNGISLVCIMAALILYCVCHRDLSLFGDCDSPLPLYRTLFCSLPILIFLIFYGILIVSDYSLTGV